jgi:hypothetical protein
MLQTTFVRKFRSSFPIFLHSEKSFEADDCSGTRMAAPCKSTRKRFILAMYSRCRIVPGIMRISGEMYRRFWGCIIMGLGALFVCRRAEMTDIEVLKLRGSDAWIFLGLDFLSSISECIGKSRSLYESVHAIDVVTVRKKPHAVMTVFIFIFLHMRPAHTMLR